MNLKTFVKVGSITNLSDARYCAGMGVDMLGFCLDQSSEDYLDVDSYKEIVGWVSGPKFVGEFESSDEDYILKMSEELKFDFLQVTDLALANALAHDNQVILKIELSMGQEDQLKSALSDLNDSVKYVLIESAEALDNDVIDSLAEIYPILRGFQLQADSIVDEITNANLKGVALKGSTEEKPGFKDYDELADILEALEIDD